MDPDTDSGHLGMCVYVVFEKKEATGGTEKQEEADKWEWRKAKPSAVEELVNAR